MTTEQLIVALAIRAVVYPYLILLTIGLGPKVYMETGKNLAFVSTHIEKIDTPTYGNDVTKNYLDQFNAQGGGIIVSYKHEFGLYRAVTITESEKSSKDEWIGRAQPGVTACSIQIKKGLDYRTYYTTLLHEYLHCMGYNHVDDPKDLMYSRENGQTEDASVDKYAKDLQETMKQWKNTKN